MQIKLAKLLGKGALKMEPNEAFHGAKAAFTFHNLYLTAVGQEFGMAKAIALESQMCENIGVMQGKFIKDKSGIKAFDAKTAYSTVKVIPEGIGIIGEILEENPQKVRFKCRHCSIYEGAQNAGLDEKTRENICRKGSIRYMDAMVKQLHPNLSYRVAKYRTSADDFCEEEIALKYSNSTCFGI
jgi:hypothetical protein